MSEFRDVYSRITNGIIADLEQGVRPLDAAVVSRACRRQDHPPAAP
jgi:antirestriction protein ArdC